MHSKEQAISCNLKVQRSLHTADPVGEKLTSLQEEVRAAVDDLDNQAKELQAH